MIWLAHNCKGFTFGFSSVKPILSHYKKLNLPFTTELVFYRHQNPRIIFEQMPRNFTEAKDVCRTNKAEFVWRRWIKRDQILEFPPSGL
jgi:hypothetical protein